MPSSGINYHKPLLILDKNGVLGSAIVNSLPKKQVVIFITNTFFKPEKNVILLPYGPGIPRIPDNTFSAILCIDFDDKQMRDFSPSLFTKVRQTNSQLFLLKSVYDVTIPFLRIYKKIFSVTSLLLYADIVSEDTPYANRAEALIYSAIKHNKVILHHSGIDLLYPVMEKDMIAWIMDILFGSKSSQIYCLFSQVGITELTLARYLRLRLEDLIVSLRENNKRLPDLLIPTSSIFVPAANYSFKEQIKKMDLQKFKAFTKVTAPVHHQKKNRRYNTTILYAAGLIVVLLLLYASPLVFAFMGKVFLQESIRSLEGGQTAQASAFTQASSDSFSLAQVTDIPLVFTCNIVGLGTTADSFNEDISTGQQLSTAMNYAIKGVTLLRSANAVNKQAADGLANIQFALTVLNQLQAENRLTMLSKQTQVELQTATTFLSQIFPVLPDVLGFSQPRQYVIFFLNNNELRPGGGFIGSYATVNIQNGQLLNVKVHDVYDADGQLQGHVDPPEPLQRYLGVSNWFLRDSNFSLEPDENGKLISYFYSLETGDTIDGVITIDTSFIKQLLQITGPIAVTDYKQTVTADNFFQLTEDHAEQKFFPGSLQKQTFLADFYQALQQHLKDQPLSLHEWLELGLNSIEQKHAQLYINNRSIQQSIEQTLVGKSERNLSITANMNTVADFFGENEANVGGNKANHYVQRNFQHTIDIDAAGNITHIATVALTNTSSTNSPYGGDYKTYLRLLIPKNAIITSLQINGKIQVMIPSIQSTNPIYKGKQVLQQAGLTVFTEAVGEENAYGFYLVVPEKTTRTVELTYTLPQRIVAQQSYNLQLYKQPGTDKDPVAVSLQISSPFHILTVNNQPSLAIMSFKQQMTLDTDRDFSVKVGE